MGMEAEEKARICGRLADEKKAKNVVIMELTELTSMTDYFLIATGTSERHVRTIADHMATSMKHLGVRPYSMEGYNDGRWVIIDYHDTIVHVFVEPLRDLYDLESLWIEAKRLRIEAENKRSGV